MGQIIFDGDFIRGTLFNAKADKLFVSFRQRIGQDGAFDEARPVQRFVKDGYAHLHLQSKFNDWYNNAETTELEARLGALHGYDRRVGIGFSMGGYAAFRFAPVLGLQHLIAVSPQYTIDSALVPQDRRYRKYAKDFDSARGVIQSNPALQGAILFDPARPLDMYHAEVLSGLSCNMLLAPLWFGGHPATGVIGSRKRFPKVQKELLSGRIDPNALIKLHRACRRGSAVYWRHLAQFSQQRGRAQLSAFASERSKALEQDTPA